jgi:hypothetical protein
MGTFIHYALITVKNKEKLPRVLLVNGGVRFVLVYLIICVLDHLIHFKRYIIDTGVKYVAQNDIFCWTLSEFEKFLLINATTCQNETSS